MGPRSEERGNDARMAKNCVAKQASMGPRSEERGNLDEMLEVLLKKVASMGPRSEERGNPGKVLVLAGVVELQWGRAPRSAETRA